MNNETHEEQQQEEEEEEEDDIFARAERKISAKATIVVELHPEVADKLRRTARFWCMSIDDLVNSILAAGLVNTRDNRGDIY